MSTAILRLANDQLVNLDERIKFLQLMLRLWRYFFPIAMITFVVFFSAYMYSSISDSFALPGSAVYFMTVLVLFFIGFRFYSLSCSGSLERASADKVLLASGVEIYKIRSMSLPEKDGVRKPQLYKHIFVPLKIQQLKNELYKSAQQFSYSTILAIALISGAAFFGYQHYFVTVPGYEDSLQNYPVWIKRYEESLQCQINQQRQSTGENEPRSSCAPIIRPDKPFLDPENATLASGLMFYFVIALIFALNRQNKLSYLRVEVESVETEQDLVQYSTSIEEERADKLFRINQHSLGRYYETNLAQNRRLFGFGVVIMLMGVLISLYTMSLITSYAEGESKFEPQAGLAALVGVVTTLMTGYVANIYLQVHQKNSNQFASFHDMLVSTSDLFLANVILSRIGNKKIAESQFVELAKSIGKRHKPDTFVSENTDEGDATIEPGTV